MGVTGNCCGGFVDPERMYKVEILCEILRIKESTITAAVRKGLEVITIHMPDMSWARTGSGMCAQREKGGSLSPKLGRVIILLANGGMDGEG